MSGNGCPYARCHSRHFEVLDPRYDAVFLAMAMFTPGVAECMVRQDAKGLITVHLVPEQDASFEAARATFADRFAELVDTPVPLTIVAAERVELTPGGKGRFVESAYRPDQVHQP